MNVKRSVKLIKNAEREDRKIQAVSESGNPNKWSAAVRSWVNEFQQDRREESLPSFNRFFRSAGRAT
jgi:fructose-1,6-bisphosphatase